MNFAFSFSGSIQEEGQQDPPKMEVLKGHNGLSKANNYEPSKEETRGALSFIYFLPFSMSLLLPPLFLLLLLPPSLLLLSLRVNNLFLTGSFSRRTVVIELVVLIFYLCLSLIS